MSFGFEFELSRTRLRAVSRCRAGFVPPRVRTFFECQAAAIEEGPYGAQRALMPRSVASRCASLDRHVRRLLDQTEQELTMWVELQRRGGPSCGRSLTALARPAHPTIAVATPTQNAPPPAGPASRRAPHRSHDHANPGCKLAPWSPSIPPSNKGLQPVRSIWESPPGIGKA